MKIKIFISVLIIYSNIFSINCLDKAIKLNLIGSWGGERGNWVLRLIDDFSSEYPEIKINYLAITGGGSSVYQKSLLTALNSENPPDIFFEWGGELAGYFIDKGYCEPFEKYYTKYSWHKILIGWTVNLSNRKGKLYGVPISANAMTFWYNKKIFNKLNLKEPLNYSELEKICETAKASGVYPISLAGKFNWHIMRLLDYLLETSCGPALHDRLNSLEVSWNRKEVIEAFKLFKKWINNEWIIKDFINMEPVSAKYPLYSGASLLELETSAFESIIISDKADPFNFDFFVPPTENQPSRMAGYPHQFMINSKSKNKDAAAKFLNFWLRKDIQTKYLGKIVSFPSTAGIKYDENILPGSYKWSTILNDTKHLFLPSDQVFDEEILKAFYTVQNSLIAGVLTPEQAAEKMQNSIEFIKGVKKNK